MNRADYNALRAAEKASRMALDQAVADARKEQRQEARTAALAAREQARLDAHRIKQENNARLQARAQELVLFHVRRAGGVLSLTALSDTWVTQKLGTQLLRRAIDGLTATGALIENRTHDGSHDLVVPMPLAPPPAPTAVPSTDPIPAVRHSPANPI